MSQLEASQEDGASSELRLQQHLQALRAAFKQQLQETEKRQTEELQSRILQNALLLADKKSADEDKADHHFKSVRRYTSELSLISHNFKQSEVVNTSPQQCERVSLCKTTQQMREEEAKAECQMKFRARPVPHHVRQPIYQEMVALREKERKHIHEQRRQFLLSIQKPFSFQGKEKEKREKLIAMSNQVSDGQKNTVTPVRKPPPNTTKDSSGAGLKDGEEVCRRVETQRAVLQETPTGPKLRTTELTRKEKLGFLDEKPSFQPKISYQIPDFRRLHKALQKEASKQIQNEGVTKCQPFFLRTSALPVRQSKMSPEEPQTTKTTNLNRSRSLGAVSLMSSDTLPTYITDAARKRSAAIRKSMEMKDSQNQESEEWLRNYQFRSEAMKRTVSLHAKLLDPHSSLKKVYNEKLQHHRAADQQRMREYTRDLREIKARVGDRPYLFEQVKQRNARAHAEQSYRSRLQDAGLKERFVEESGEVCSSDEATDQEDQNVVLQSREENVDAGEKIEDVEEGSVKSKGEEES